MTDEEAKKMLKAKLECFKNETSGINHDCNMRLCDGCSLNYEQGNMGEQKEALETAIKALEQTRWIPVSERVAEFPCLACNIFNQIFIPSGIVVLNNRCYEGKNFDFNVEKFLKGKEITSCSGKKYYVKPREITAWMPLPTPYQPPKMMCEED